MPYVTQTGMEVARKELEKELPIAITSEMTKEEYQDFPLDYQWTPDKKTPESDLEGDKFRYIITKYKERNSGSDEFPLCWTSPTEEDIAFLAELNNRE